MRPLSSTADYSLRKQAIEPDHCRQLLQTTQTSISKAPAHTLSALLRQDSTSTCSAPQLPCTPFMCTVEADTSKHRLLRPNWQPHLKSCLCMYSPHADPPPCRVLCNIPLYPHPPPAASAFDPVADNKAASDTPSDQPKGFSRRMLQLRGFGQTLGFNGPFYVGPPFW